MTRWDVGALLLLGAFHGANPAMGWLFATSIGLQERARRPLVAAFGPIAVGHVASMAATVLVVDQLRLFVSDTALRIAAALGLAAFAVSLVARSHVHPRWVGMRLNRRELALWSFLMSTAHGAGLMLIPIVLGLGVHASGAMLMPSTLAQLGAAVLVHTAAMVCVASAIALAVYEFLGVGILRRRWVNFERLWPVALGLGAIVMLVAA